MIDKTIKRLLVSVIIITALVIGFFIVFGNAKELHADPSAYWQLRNNPNPRTYTFNSTGNTYTVKTWTAQTGDREVTMYWNITGAISGIKELSVNTWTQTGYTESYNFYGLYIPADNTGDFRRNTRVSVPITSTGSYVFKNIAPFFPDYLNNDFVCDLDYIFYTPNATYGTYVWNKDVAAYCYIIPKPQVYAPYFTSSTTGSLNLEASCVNESTSGSYYFIVNGTWYPAVRVVGNDTDTITATVTGLKSGTTYSVQAYASNIAGNAYSVKQDIATDRALSSNAALSKIETSAGQATVASNGTTYNITVPFETSSITVYPHTSDAANAFISVNYSGWDWSGSAFGPYYARIGTNAIPIKVIAEDGTQKEYNLNVIKNNPSPPVVAISTAKSTQICSAVPGYTDFSLDGTVEGSGLNVTVSASINGKTESVMVATPQSGTAFWSLSWDVYGSNIEQNSYTPISVSASNGYSNGSVSATWNGTLVVDRTTPTAPSLSANPSGWGNSSAAVTVTPGTDSGGAGILKTEYSTDGYIWNTYSSPFSISTEGTTTVYARTIDSVENISDTSSTKVYIDKTAPYPPWIVANQEWSKENLSVVINKGYDGDSGISKTQYSFDDGKTWADYSGSLAISTSGTTTIVAKNIDKAGNWSETSEAVVRIDKIAPTVDSVTGNPSGWVFAPITLVVNASDTGGSGLGINGFDKMYSFDNGSTWQATNSRSYYSNQNGIIIKVKDIAGNISEPYSTINITNIDSNYPTYTSITGNPSSWQNTDVILTINGAADAGSGLATLPYSFDGGTTWQESNQKTFSSNSNPYIKIRDAVGRLTECGNIIISKIDKTPPQDFTVNRSTSSVTNGDVVLTITGARDNESGLATLPYSFDNGATWQTENTRSYSANESSIILKVKDVMGNVREKAVSITNIDKTAPVLVSGTAKRTGGSSASVSFSTGEAGKGYFIVVADGAAAPSSQSVVGSGRELNDACSVGSVSFNVTTGLGISSDSAAYDIYMVIKDSANNLSLALKADVVAYATGTDNGIMKYIMPLGGSAFNIQGMVNGSWTNITNSDGLKLYQTVNTLQTDWDSWDYVSEPSMKLTATETEINGVSNGVEKINDGLGVKVNLSFVDEGKYVKVEYVLRNTSAGALTGVGIANILLLPRIDGTALTVKKLSDGRGFYAPTSIYNGQINFIVRNSANVTDVDKYWIGAGFGNPATGNKWNQNENFETFTNTGFPPSVGAAYSWQGMTLAAGETKTLSVLIGMIQKNYTTTLSISDIGLVNCGDTFKLSGSLTDTASNAKGYDLYYSIDGGSQSILKHFDTAPGSFSGLDLLIPEGLSGERSIKFYLTNSSDGIEEVSANVVTKSFTIKTYAVDFNINSGSGQPATQNIQLNQLVTAPTDPARAYYTFGGWYKEAALTNLWDFAADKVTAAQTLYAKWTAKTCAITFSSGGGSEFTDKTVTADSAVGTLPESARDGYVFGGWWTAVNGGGTQYSAQTVYKTDGNRTLYAKWTANKYTIAFDSQGGSDIDDKIVSYDAAIGTLSDTSRTGYAFGGWYTLPNGEGDKYTSSTVYPTVGGSNLYAKWTIKSYTVTFKGKNSEGADGTTFKTQTEVTHGDSATAPDVPAAEGYSFLNWDNSFSSITGDTIITAQYESLPEYTIAASAGTNGSISSSPSVIYAGDSVTYTITPASNYHISDVYIDGSSYGKISSYTFTKVGANHEIKAFFEIDTYTVTFLDWDGSTVSTGTVAYKGTASAPTHPLRTNFDSNGWDPAVFTNITQNAVFTAQYTAIPTYTVTASAGTNGSVSSVGSTTLMRGQGKIYTITPSNGYKTASVKVDGEAQLSSGNPVTGYTFSGISSNHTIAALFTPLTYAVTFMDFDGSVIKTQTVSYGGDAEAPPTSRTGYTFTNWDKSFANVTSSLSITAQYKINQYTIVFDTQGAVSAIPSKTGQYDTQINMPAVPQKEGFIFDGWFKNSGCTTGKDWSFSGKGSGVSATSPDTIKGDQTLYAKWVTKKYRVVFTDNDGTTLNVNDESYQEVSSGESATAPSTPGDKTINGQTKTFKKWSTSFSSIKADTTVKALYMDVQRTVTFNWNYTDSPSAEIIFADDATSVVAPLSFERTGYSFVDWYTDAAGTKDKNDLVDPDTFVEKTFTGDAAYYAKWNKKQYTVKFIDYSGKTLKSSSVEHASDAVAPTVPAREGYSFKGWDKNFTNITSYLVVNALYEAIPQYTITAVSGSMAGITPGGSIKVYEGSDKTFSILPSTGFKLTQVLVDGKEQKSSGDPVSSYTFTDVSSNHVISADSAIKTYSVRFLNYAGAAIGDAYTVSHGDSLLPPNAPEKEGYSFTGWNKSPENITGNMDVSALYSAKTYNVNFETSGAEPISSISASYDSKINPPAPPEKTGYTFGGWFKQAALTGAWNFDNDTIPAANVTLYAKWTVKTYTVTFTDYDNSTIKVSGNNTQTVNYGNSAVKPSDPGSKEINGQNREFEAWSVAFNSITDNLTVKALYVGKKYTLSFDPDYNDIDAETVVADDGTTAQAPASPNRTGYTFGGWYAGKGGTGTQFNEGAAITVAAQYYAKWTQKTYAVSFNLNGGSSVSGGGISQTVSHGNSASAPGDPQKDGYRFTGWDREFGNITGAITVTAQYSKIPKYTISINAGTGGKISPESKELLEGSNQDFTITANTGYKIAEVLADGITEKDSNGDPIESVKFTNLMKNRSISATFELDSFAVTYNHQNGEQSVSTTALYGSLLDGPENPQKTGYAFSGWYKQQAYTSQWNFNVNTVPAEAVNLYAKWTPRTYIVEFEGYEGEGNTSAQTKCFDSTYGKKSDGATAELLPVLTKDGSTFKGWWTGEKGTGTLIENTTKFDKTNRITLYAKWSENKMVAPTITAVKYDSSAYTRGSWTNTSQISITVEAEDNGTGIKKYQYQAASDGIWKDMSGDDLNTLGISSSTNDSYKFRTISDSDTQGEETEPYSLKLDITKPSINSMQIKNVNSSLWQQMLNVMTFGKYFNNKIEVKIQFSDAHSGPNKLAYKFVPEGSDANSINYTTYQLSSSDLSAGFKILDKGPDFKGRFYAYITDATGNQSDASGGAFTTDTTLPAVTFNSANPNFDSSKWYESSVFEFKVRDLDAGLDKVEIYEGGTLKETWSSGFSQDSNGLNTIQFTGSYTASAPGQYAVKVRAYDRAGNVNEKEINVKLISCKVSYNANGATAGKVPTDKNVYTIGDRAIVLGNTGNLEKTGYIFSNWGTRKDSVGTGYSESGSLQISGDSILYAQWMIKTYTVTFTNWDKSLIKKQVVKNGSNAEPPETPLREGYKFIGWDKNYKNITENTELTAKYLVDNEEVALSTSKIADAARNLTLQTAFRFSQGDTWECVTSDFILLQIEGSGMQVKWTSSKPAVLRIEGGGEKISGVVFQPEEKDEIVTVTAEISQGNESITKSFLIVVKRKGASRDEVRQVTERSATIQTKDTDGDSRNYETIYRTVLNDGTKIDTVIVTQGKVAAILESTKNDSEWNGFVSIAVDNPETDFADEIALEIPGDVFSALAARNAGITINTPDAVISFSAEEVAKAYQTGTDAYFRVLPINEEALQQEARNVLLLDKDIISLANADSVNFIGIPLKIDTNMSGYSARVILPFGEIDKKLLAETGFSDSLHVFVEHEDNTREILEGKIVLVDGKPYGIEINIVKFSRFQIVSIGKNSEDSNNAASRTLIIWLVSCMSSVAVLVILFFVLFRKKIKRQKA